MFDTSLWSNLQNVITSLYLKFNRRGAYNLVKMLNHSAQEIESELYKLELHASLEVKKASF